MDYTETKFAALHLHREEEKTVAPKNKQEQGKETQTAM